MDMNYKIRRMSIQDAPEAARLEASSFSMPWTLADFEYEMRSNPVARYVVAEQGGRLLGFYGEVSDAFRRVRRDGNAERGFEQR